MSFLRNLPVTFECELHDVRIINFSVNKEEVTPFIPVGIDPADFDGWAMISMADLKVKKMRPRGLPEALSFSYRHIALRLMVHDLEAGSAIKPKVYFFKSFADKHWVTAMGNLFTHYNLYPAEMDDNDGLHLKGGGYFIKYQLTEGKPLVDERLVSCTRSLHSAYTESGTSLRTFRISPEYWPIEPVSCPEFDTNLFRSARLSCAFRATQTISFQRFPSEAVFEKRLGLNPDYSFH